MYIHMYNQIQTLHTPLYIDKKLTRGRGSIFYGRMGARSLVPVIDIEGMVRVILVFPEDPGPGRHIVRGRITVGPGVRHHPSTRMGRKPGGRGRGAPRRGGRTGWGRRRHGSGSRGEVHGGGCGIGYRHQDGDGQPINFMGIDIQTAISHPTPILGVIMVVLYHLLRVRGLGPWVHGRSVHGSYLWDRANPEPYSPRLLHQEVLGHIDGRLHPAFPPTFLVLGGGGSGGGLCHGRGGRAPGIGGFR